MRAKVLFALAVACLVAADKQDAGKKDQDSLQGTWVLKSIERGGKEVNIDQDEHIPRTITFKGNQVSLAHKQGEHKGTFQLGQDGKMGTIDLTPDDPQHKDRPLRALYRVEGDTLTICVNEAKNGDRPKEFAAKEGSHQAVITFTREKK
jgi:uncharacterized protein (TIGR03067 family)